MDVEVLDCTLRDGGYVNNWDFGKTAMGEVLRKLEAAGVEIIECGFLTQRPRGEDCALFASPEEIRPLLPPRRRAMFVAMVALGEDGFDPGRLPPRGEGDIDGIRLTFRREGSQAALSAAAAVMDRGYRVFLQPVGTAFYSDLELLRLVEQVDRLSPFAFYIVDTLGSMYPSQVLRQFALIDRNLGPQVRVGFHGHNNLQLAFSNAQALLLQPTRRRLVIDSSVYGMGRGAGNLPTELITRYINQNHAPRYDTARVLDVYDQYIAPLGQRYPWGYSMAYHVAAVNACHPNYAAYLLNKRTLTARDVENVLRSIPPESRAEFDKGLIRRLYRQYQSRACDDGPAVEELSALVEGRTLLALAPGPGLEKAAGQVRAFIRERGPLVFAVNSAAPGFSPDVCFVSSHKGLDTLGPLPEGARLALTSNLLPWREGDCLVADYDSCLADDPMVGDNAGLMLLTLLARCGAQEVWLAGFDGGGGPSGEAAEGGRRAREQLARLPLGVRFLTPSAWEDTP